MKILELTNFSAGICGVWQRVKQEAVLLAKKHKVVVMSSNWTKGSDQIASSREKRGNVEILRFPAKKLGGESFLKWDFEKAAVKFAPDLIIAHSYRQLHTTKALKLAKELSKSKKVRVFLVTHAPFIPGNATRTFPAKLATIFYDSVIGPRTINRFDKILTISKWEIPFLKDLGVKKEKIFYSPNGVPEEFFKQKKSKTQKKILFLGRVAPIKNLEVLIKAMASIKDKKIPLEVVGPEEKEYFSKLKEIIKSKKLDRKIKFVGPIYNLSEKIKKIDSAEIFVLPSKRESMPQALIEAMSRGKIIVASKNDGTNDLIQDMKNGILFENDNALDLAKKLDLALGDTSLQKRIQAEAKNTAEQFRWSRLIKNMEKLF